MSVVTKDDKATLRQWHEELQEKRGLRASLRRSKTVNDACLAEGLHSLLMQTHSLWKNKAPECYCIGNHSGTGCTYQIY